MNLQRREEISALLAAPVTGGAGQVLEYRDALMECRAHIDALEQAAAERVIARGAAVKPHTFGEIVNQVRDIASQYTGTEQLRERIAYALAPHFEHDAGPTPDYTGEGSAWVSPVEARAVVVPDLTPDDCLDLDEILQEGPPYDEVIPKLAAWICEHSRAIPAGRVLGEGVGALRRFAERCAQRDHQPDEHIGSAKCVACEAEDALRANQGGAAT